MNKCGASHLSNHFSISCIQPEYNILLSPPQMFASLQSPVSQATIPMEPQLDLLNTKKWGVVITQGNIRRGEKHLLTRHHLLPHSGPPQSHSSSRSMHIYTTYWWTWHERATREGNDARGRLHSSTILAEMDWMLQERENTFGLGQSIGP